jgi:preprotein translocase subunit SecA
MPAQTDDKVWFDSQRRFAGICADVASFRSQQQNILLLAHFPTTLSVLQQALRAASIGFETFSLADSSLLCSMETRGRVLVGLVRAFQPTMAQTGSGSEAANLQIIVAEHHPINGKDRSVVETAERLSCKPTVCFHASLDDPLMKHFGSDQIVTLFKRLGADEAEAISHPFVTSAIQNAQEKIEKQVQKDIATESMEDWFRFNMRKNWS